MSLLRLGAVFWLMYVVLHFLRSLLGSYPGQQGQGPQVGRRQQRPPFNPYGPFGPFGPFGQQGPQGPQAQQQQQQQRRQPPPPSRPQEPRAKTAHEILGIGFGATSAEVRRAYQDLVRQYHPDRTADLAPELRELAEQRTKEITNAYNQLKRGG